MNLVKKIRQHQGPLRMCPVVVTSFEIAMRDRKFLQVNRSAVAYLALAYKNESIAVDFINYLDYLVIYIKT